MSRKPRSGKETPYNELVDEAHICCEQFDFRWDRKRHIPVFREMWKEGYSIHRIAEHFCREPEEVLFLVVDQLSLRGISHRKRGIWGVVEK